jgi:mannose-6-phosphate isomerase-like protein (cupin superfamily)
MDELDHHRPQMGYTWARLLEMHRGAARPYLEFLRSASLSAGLFVLPAGGVDEQEPHTEDEVYVVVAGGALFTAGEETREVRAGDVLFVAAGVPHRFHDISEDLRVIVVFAPPEGSASAASGSPSAHS